MGLLLGAAALWYIYKPVKLPILSNNKTAAAGGKENDGSNAQIWRAVQRDAELANLRTVALLEALYWVTQASAHLYPGSRTFDHLPGRADPDPTVQAKLEGVVLMLLGAGWWLERRRIMKA